MRQCCRRILSKGGNNADFWLINSEATLMIPAVVSPFGYQHHRVLPVYR